MQIALWVVNHSRRVPVGMRKSLAVHAAGLQATEIVADVTVTAQQSTRGRAAAVAHSMSVFVDAAAAAAGTIKQKQLLDDMMVGVAGLMINHFTCTQVMFLV